MLHSLNDLVGFRLFSQDDEPVGVIVDLLFDAQVSMTRYLLIEPESWWPHGELLLAPEALDRPDPDHRRVRARIPFERLKSAPRHRTPAVPERDEEVRLHEHFRWRPYWTSGVLSELIPYWGLAGAEASAAAAHDRSEPDEPLRRARKVLSFEIATSDGQVGRVDDLVLDLDSWTFRYLVVDTSGWLPGKRVLVSPQWLRRVDWSRRTLVLDLPIDRIRSSPEYDRSAALDRRFEEMLHEHVGRQGYW